MNFLNEDTLDKTIIKNNYSLKEIMKIIFIQDSNITKQECYERAKNLKYEIDKINTYINRNTGEFFTYNIPFSYFEDDENFLEFFDIQN